MRQKKRLILMTTGNVLVVWDDTVVAQKYLSHWASRWAQGTDWKQTY